MRRPVVITGLACISSLGCSRERFTQGLLDGETGIRPITQFDVSGCRSAYAGRVIDFDPTAYLPPLKLRRIDAVARVAIACTRDALDDAGIARTAEGHDDVGVVLGSVSAGVHATGEYLESFWKGGPQGAPALLFSSTVGNAPASQCGLEYGLRGPNTTLMHKEASGLSALVFGTHLVRRGKAGAIVAGGADDIDERFYKVHDWFGVMAPSRVAPGGDEAPSSAPFDAHRSGFVMGEGGFMLVLEAEERAAARGATVLADVLGTGASSSSCAVNEWPSDDEALLRCMRLAIADAGLQPEAIDLVYASANGTAALDRWESSALARAFGPRAVPVTSVKGALGEFSAAGAASLAAAILCGRRGLVCATHGLRDLAPECPVDAAPTTRPVPGPPSGPTVLINSFASGGTNFSLVVRLRPA